MTSHYSIHQRVEATVESVYSFGVFARLDDGTRAYIRRRELDLDADNEPFEVVQPRDRLTGLVIGLSQSDGHLEISRRAALPDPWAAFVQKTQVGDVLRGEVRRLAPAGVFVRVAAGVHGYLHPSEMAPWQVDRPEELYWIGDQVEAVVKEISLGQHRLSLSVRAHMAERERAVTLFEELFPKGTNGSAQSKGKHPSSLGPGAEPQAVYPALHLVGKLLILEDNEALRRSLEVWFRRRGLEVIGAGSVAAGLQACSAPDLDYVLLDLSLPDGDGLALVRQLTGRSPSPHIFIMSSSDTLIERLDDLLRLPIAQIFPKPLDMGEIGACLAQIASGENVQVFQPAGAGSLAIASEAAPQVRLDDSQANLQQRLEEALAQVHKSVKAQETILFRLDPVTQAYAIQALAGAIELDHDVLYHLGDSPVKDALRSGALVVEGRAQSAPGDGKGRYQKLLDLLPFESCLGLPLAVQGERTHALFFFHSQPDVFNHYRQRDARAGAFYLTALLEEAAADERLQALSPVLISGQLASGFGHEVANQVSSLELELLNQLSNPGDPAEALAALVERVQELKAITLSFQRILWARDQADTCDLQSILEHAYQAVKPFARKNKTRIQLAFCPDLPGVHANPVALQQVLANVLLNAIQQIGLKAEKSGWEGARRVEVRTCQAETPGMIAIRIQDTGPGIHRRLWNKIFAAGFSTRGGSGMGLYLSQSILRQCGGSIAVEESHIPCGTTFLIQLPAYTPGENP